MKILIIEDEYNLADAIKSILVEERYDVTINTDGEVGLDNALSGIYDLIILDVMLPHVNGFEILKKIREEKIEIKVIMLTAKNSIEDKMQGFQGGADDYLTKPFYMEELLARVNLQLRKRSGDVYNKKLEVGDIALDISKLELISLKTSESINVIGKEFQLLELFMHHPNQVLEKEQIFIKIWGYDSESDMNTLEAYISFLRKKLKLLSSCIIIKSIRNIGYKFEVKNK